MHTFESILPKIFQADMPPDTLVCVWVEVYKQKFLVFIVTNEWLQNAQFWVRFFKIL